MSSVVPWGLARPWHAVGAQSLLGPGGYAVVWVGETECLAQMVSLVSQIEHFYLEGPRRQEVQLVLLTAVSAGPG